MGLEIKLDTAALASLIESDPNFKLKLQQCVLSNITDRYMKSVGEELDKEIERKAEIARNSALEAYGRFERQTWGSKFVLSATLYENLIKRVTEVVDEVVNVNLDPLITEAVTKRVTNLDMLVNNRVSSAVNKIIKDAVDSHVNSQVATMVEDAVRAKLNSML